MNHLRNQIRNKMKRDVNPRYIKMPTRESIQLQAEFYGEF